MVPMIEAKDCNKVWTCKGDDRCRADCQNQFKGKGICYAYSAPFRSSAFVYTHVDYATCTKKIGVKV